VLIQRVKYGRESGTVLPARQVLMVKKCQWCDGKGKLEADPPYLLGGFYHWDKIQESRGSLMSFVYSIGGCILSVFLFCGGMTILLSPFMGLLSLVPAGLIYVGILVWYDRDSECPSCEGSGRIKHVD
jgi:hypothetical protein